MINSLVVLVGLATAPHKIQMLRLNSGIYVVETNVGRLLVDTGNGSEHVLLSEAVSRARRIETKPYKSKQKSFAVGSEVSLESRIGTLPELEIGDIKLQSVPILSTKAVDDLAVRTKEDISGILGYSFFKDYCVTFDYGSRVMTLDTQTVAPSTTYPISINPAVPLVVLDIDVAGAGTRKFVIDTGASADVISRKLMTDLGLKSLRKVPMQGARGAAEADLIKLPEITVAGQKSTSPLAVAADFVEDLGKILGIHLDGVIGQTTLNQFVFTIDYKHNRIWATSRAL